MMTETGRCYACGRFFARENNLTRHLRNNCEAALRRSQAQWKRGVHNLAKLDRPSRGNQSRIQGEPHSHGHSSHIEPIDLPQHTATAVVPEGVDAMDTSDPLPEKRIRRPTWKIRESMRDDLPEGPGALTSPAVAAANNTGPLSTDSGPASPPPNPPHILTKICTTANRFALVREYQQHPSAIPDSQISWDSLIPDHINALPRKHRKVSDIIYPYPNISSFLYNYTWKRMGGIVSASSRASMTKTLRDERFKTCDLEGVNFLGIEKKITDDIQSPWGGNGWRRTNIIIEVPTGKKPTMASRRAETNMRARMRRHDQVDPDADPYPRHKLPIHDVRTRSLLHTMVEAVQEDLPSREIHWHGYEERWQPPYPGFPSERVWGDLYTSDAFLSAERDLLGSQVDPSRRCVIIAYMFWSDSTHLAQFGQAKAWPIYAYIGNQTKYTRCKPSVRSVRVVGYIPPLPDSFAEGLKACGVSPTAPLLTHCRRELFHSVWRLILDPDFLNAYEHGVSLTCSDGVLRQVYPRIFTYSADYPEKVLIATIRDMGGCPCPRCTIKKEDFYALGTTEARDNIYRKGYTLQSEPGVERLLKGDSLVPTLNTFSHSLKDFNFDIFLTLVVDVLHEFELGVWKALLTHLIRILHSLGARQIQEFNSRNRAVWSLDNPSFYSQCRGVKEARCPRF
ncbi:hypothetical protein EDB92DRAFT_176878 [Lactarius akahatsu]|uniref:C2H2-type domain-containing protein n=1 Tax=Lactarius akahatsu TaxID=416441 RepID=A0AAD4Q3P0_9AGAM|nr:hypothetical protein EDB92DRAFT_176878 [Lactarius akahatsu]